MDWIVTLYVPLGYLDRPEKVPGERRKKVAATGCRVVESADVTHVHTRGEWR